MKKNILGFILLLFTVNLSHAQNTGFEYGINGGVTLSSMRFVFYVPQEKLIQGQGGLTVRYISEKNFGLQAELNYSQRGWKEQSDDIRINRYSRSISYLELPFMTHIYFNMGKRFRGVFNIGPQIGYCLSEKTLEKVLYAPGPSNNGENIIYEGIPSYYSQDVQKKFDYGIAGGGGLEFRTGIGSFILEGRYYFGLSDVFNNTRSDYFQASSNQVISIKLTYLTSFQ
ncbi:MAG: PorT family protein [Bacteroidales bacterium]|nr:PorT family protein [Bacteroidales bacterium]